MNTVTETILETADRISRVGLIDALIDGVTRRIVPQTTAAANCTGHLNGSSCRTLSDCNPPYGNGKFQYMYDTSGNYCGWICCH